MLRAKSFYTEAREDDRGWRPKPNASCPFTGSRSKPKCIETKAISEYSIYAIAGTVASMTESDPGVQSEKPSYNTLG